MIQWLGLTDKQLAAVTAVTGVQDTPQADIAVTCTQTGTGLRVTRDGDVGTLAYGAQNDLMRAAALYAGLAQEQHQFDIAEGHHFEVLAAMIDVARNGVPTVAMLKTILRRLASMGYNEMWLYLEDLFEIPGVPYFGIQRGRYSQADLHEVASYGDELGVTVVPAVQTLAHMHNALKWEAHQPFTDTSDTLLVGADATKTFLRRLLTAASAPFTTNKIHVGMDEAYQLGRGHYLDQNGFTDQQTLIMQQLKLVVQLCDELGLDPYMWSDLWFTFASPKHEMYDPDVHFTPDFKAQLPKVGQVYWDYYHEDEQTYRDRFAQHFELSDNVVFAGGIWTWSALAPNQSKMMANVEAGLKAARATGVQQVVATSWYDDGSEVPFSAMWYGLQTFAAYQYHDAVSEAVVDRDYVLTQAESPDFYKALDEFDNFTGGINKDADNVSKIVLYEDLLVQRYAANLEGIDLEGQYDHLMQTTSHARLRSDNQLMVQFYHQLAGTVQAKFKALAAVRALKTGGTTAGDVAIAAITDFTAALQQLSPVFAQIWHQQRRGNGYEVIDIRLGGQLMRAQTVIWRIREWQAGRDDLAELFAPTLPMDKYSNGRVGHGLYKQIVSACDISF